jgi:O-antigen ligase
MKAVRMIAPSRAAAMFSWTVAVAAAWLAVGSQAWGLTFLLAAVGGLYLVYPPSGVFPKSILALFGLLLLLSLTAFLPASFGGAALHGMFADHGIVLPSTLSPQPWLSLENLTLLFATLLWAWSCFEFKLSLDQREFLLTSYLLALGLVAIVTIIPNTPLEAGLPELLRTVGQFANRNQTGDLLVMGGIGSFAWGVYNLSKRNLSGIFWLLLTTIFMTAATRNGSRAAEALFGAGLFLSFFLLPRIRRRNSLVPVVAFAAIIGCLFIFVTQGTELQDRFRQLLGGQHEGRVGIYRDAFAMILHDPWCGVGLGNFAGVFNVQRVASVDYAARCLHPESDWLWVAAELGIPGAIVAALLVIQAFRIYLGTTPFPSLTKICTAVAILFLIHSLFDVGGHRLGTIWSCLYLVSLGAFRPATSASARVPTVVLRLAGLLLLVVAGLRVQSMSLLPLMPTAASVEKVKSALIARVPPLEQKQHVDQALAWAPLDYQLYYQRALACMQIPELADKSDDDFNRALYLEQSSLELPINIGELCRRTDFPEALAAWQSLLQRAGPRRQEMFENLCASTHEDGKARLQLTTLTDGDPNLQTISLLYETRPEFDWLLENLLGSDPSLNGVDPDLMRRLFDHWVDVGDPAQFLDKWPQYPEWQSPGWRAYAKALAQAARFKEAVTTTFQYLPAPRTPTFQDKPNLDDAKLQYQNNPQDPFTGIRLYFAEVGAGLNDQAVATLQEISKLPKPPDYIEYLLAKSLTATGQDEAAWQALQPLVDVSPSSS